MLRALRAEWSCSCSRRLFCGTAAMAGRDRATPPAGGALRDAGPRSPPARLRRAPPSHSAPKGRRPRPLGRRAGSGSGGTALPFPWQGWASAPPLGTKWRRRYLWGRVIGAESGRRQPPGPAPGALKLVMKTSCVIPGRSLPSFARPCRSLELCQEDGAPVGHPRGRIQLRHQKTKT